MSTVFISHSSTDKSASERVRNWLRDELNLTAYFLDFDEEKGLIAGRHWEDELYRRLRQCRAVVALTSEAWLKSPWCFAEVTHARSAGKPVFLVKVGNCQTTNVFRDVQHVDLTVDEALGLRQLARGLREAGIDPREVFEWKPERLPYPGLAAFEELDASVFFGRHTEVQRALERLRAAHVGGSAPFLLMVGPSGSGKSSLLRAGVLAQLRKDKKSWLCLSAFRPGTNPMRELAIKIADAFKENGASDGWQKVLERLRPPSRDFDREASGLALAELAFELADLANERDSKVLIAIDQAEELLGATDPTSASEFFGCLQVALASPDQRLIAVATLRSDSLTTFQRQPDLRSLDYRLFPIAALEAGALRETIEGPARVSAIDLEPGLVDALLRDVGSGDALPILAFTLCRLYEASPNHDRLELDAYKRLGRVQGSVQQVADEVVKGLPADSSEMKALRQAFTSCLVRIGENDEFRRRRAVWRELPSAAMPLLEKLDKARLLVSGEENGERTIEVSHETLFNSWPQLSEWLKEDKKFLDWRRRLSASLDNHARYGESVLLRGRQLAEALRWQEEMPYPLTPQEQEFIGASARMDTQEQQRWKALYETAERERTLALSRGLAVRAELARLQDPELLELSVLLALESMKRYPSAEAELSLRRGLDLALTPELIIPCLAPVISLSLDPEGRQVAIGAGNDAYILEIEAHKMLASVPQGGLVNSVVFSPDGKYVASASRAKTLIVWGVETATVIARIDLETEATRVLFSPDGAFIAVLGSIGESIDDASKRAVSIWDSRTGERLGACIHPASVAALAFSPTGSRLACSAYDDCTRLWDFHQGVATGELAQKEFVSDLAYSPDGSLLLTGDDKGGVRLWNGETGALVWEERHTGKVSKVVFGLLGKRFAAGWASGMIRVWNAQTHEEVSRFQLEEAPFCLVMAPDEQLIASCTGRNSIARLWDIASSREIGRASHGGCVNDLAISADGHWLVTASGHTQDAQPVGGSVRVWNLSAQRISTRMSHGESIEQIEFSADGYLLASASWDNTARVWDPRTGQMLTCVDHGCHVFAVHFHPQGHWVVSGCEKGARVWEARTGKEILHLDDYGTGRSVTFAPTGTLLATGGHRCAAIWELSEGRQLHRLEHGNDVSHVAFSPDARTLFTTSDQTVFEWDTRDGTKIRELTMAERIWGCSLSNDGKYLLTLGFKQICLWEAASGQLIETFAVEDEAREATFSLDSSKLVVCERKTVHVLEVPSLEQILSRTQLDFIHGISFSPDGRYLALGCTDNAARVWDATTGEEVARLVHEASVSHVVFSPDGKYLVAQSDDHVITCWLWSRELLIKEAQQRLTRNMTWEEWQVHVGEQNYSKTCPTLPVHDSVVTHALGMAISGNVDQAKSLLLRIQELEPALNFDLAEVAARMAGKEN